MKSVRLSSNALNLALAAAPAAGAEQSIPISPNPTESPIDAEQLLWADLVDSGLATAPLELQPDWAEALTALQKARIIHHLTSQYGQVTLRAELAVEGPFTISVLRRHGVGSTTDGTDRTDSKVELSFARGDRTWSLARRVLPPFDEFTTAPRQVAAPAESPLQLPAELAARLRSQLSSEPQLSPGTVLASTPELAGPILDLLHAKAAVSCVTVIRQCPTQTAGVIAMTFWVLGSDGLYRVASGDRPGIFRTLPGDLGFRLIWNTLGAVNLISLATRLAVK